MSDIDPKVRSDGQKPESRLIKNDQPETEPSLPSQDVDLGMSVASSPEGFGGKQIRKILHEDEWWFSIIDVIEVLVGGDRPSKYWNDLKKKLQEEGHSQVSEKIGKLKMPSPSGDGKSYPTDCANTETLFRIIQSIPSPKVEPLKQWLAAAMATMAFLAPWRALR